MAHYENEIYCCSNHRVVDTGLQKFSTASKKNSKCHLKLRKIRVEAKKKHECFLENVFLFIGLHLTVNEVCK